ncbi:MAG TPA: hypothetical protein VMT19_09080 [Thermoanaerobaculaceae bacterium]|nr:hypothetical protein [Thermoanaerobaculaceae bacterium]
MAGPVWRFQGEMEGTCDACLRRCRGMYVEGEVARNELRTVRALCPACAVNVAGLVVSGEDEGRAKAPAYAHNAGTC